MMTYCSCATTVLQALTEVGPEKRPILDWQEAWRCCYALL